MTCPSCKRELDKNINYCPNCGKRFIKKSRGCLIGAVSVLAIFLFFFLLMVISAIRSVGSISQTPIVNSEYLFGKGDKKVVVVAISGMIADTDSTSPLDFSQTITSPKKINRIFENLKKDSDVVGVILEINSPGGTVTASNSIYEIVTRYKNDTKIPVIASFSDLAASGGYLVALSADKIFTDPTTLTGSIGAIIESVNLTGLSQKLGVTAVVVKSGEHKDILNPMREGTSEETKIMQGLVDEAAAGFNTLVTSRRKIPLQYQKEIADGRIYSGSQAITRGLADSEGSLYSAVDEIKKLAKLSDVSVYEIGKPSFLESFLTQKLSFITLNKANPAGILYLYRTGL